MYGAILGDIIGSPFEFDRGNKSKNFELFSPDAEFTDDTVMTIAGSIAEGFYGVPEHLKRECRKRLPKDFLRILDSFEVVVQEMC